MAEFIKVYEVYERDDSGYRTSLTQDRGWYDTREKAVVALKVAPTGWWLEIEESQAIRLEDGRVFVLGQQITDLNKPYVP